MAIELAQVYTDLSGLEALKAQARRDKDAALDEVSHQFESLFLQMMLKSMRKASFGGGLLDSRNTEFYRDMYDQQLAMDLSKQEGIGLAGVIKRQIGGQPQDAGGGRDPASYRLRAIPSPAVPAGQPEKVLQKAVPAVDAPPVGALDGTPEGFINTLWPAAAKAADKLALQPEALLAQSALETGWGRHVMRRADGSSSHNLFGIKADDRWQGERVSVSTLEYRDGVAVRTRADFRAYGSWEESFRDYVHFIQDNPRYGEAVRSSGDAERYFEQLQKAGYATDPAYAKKIGRILRDSPLSAIERPAMEDTKAG